MSEQRFALKESVQNFAGGSMAYGPDGETVDLAAELEKGGGVIVTEDPRIIASLETNPAFKSATKAAAEEAAAEVAPDETEGLNDKTVKELSDQAEEEGAEGVTSRSSKSELLTATRAKRASEEG